MLKDKHLVLVILSIAFFFLVNALWIKLDSQLPIIGDDARWLEETNRMTEVVKTGDFAKIWQKWETMFIENTNSFPRTPLFTLMSVPVFLLTGPNENAAITINAFLLVLSSLLIFFLTKDLFNGVKNKKNIALIAVLIFNLFPGYFGFARLYMSEILQTFLILLICRFIVRFKENFSIKVWFVLGVLLALAMLLRFLMPIYLLLPVCYFLYYQFRQKREIKEYFQIALAFCLGFLPIFLSWYGKNFFTYLEFSQFTSSGELAEITSLGPVWSLTTMLRFWKVIGLWHFGWPILASIVVIIVMFVSRFRLSIIKKFKGKNKTNKALLILLLLPLPAFIISTLSLNKTARYLLPVEVFWIILIAFFVNLVWHSSKKIGKFLLIGLLVLLLYQFVQGVSKNIPDLPMTGQILSAGQYIETDPKEEKYAYIFEYFSDNSITNKSAKTYLIPEQINLNDAELIWYFTQKGFTLNSIGEFSSYTTIEQGETKLEQADYVIIDTAPSIQEKYLGKYEEMLNKVINGNYFSVEKNEQLNLEIFVRVN
jgi:4-amino-4-deoxy-L-arabinose transferase-like glycosyltransferase